MLIYPEFARGALEILGSLQAKEDDPYRDAEPGKILHELRYGELAHFKLIPHTPYYGTADATPLYLVTLHAAWRETGDADEPRRSAMLILASPQHDNFSPSGTSEDHYHPRSLRRIAGNLKISGLAFSRALLRALDSHQLERGNEIARRLHEAAWPNRARGLQRRIIRAR
jgi:glycogen debranching enzyme